MREAATCLVSGRAIIAGGLSGAGKSTVLDHYAGIDRSQYLTINPDDIKEKMADRGLIPQVDGLSPMEASDLVHEESSYIARRLALSGSGRREEHHLGYHNVVTGHRRSGASANCTPPVTRASRASSSTSR